MRRRLIHVLVLVGAMLWAVSPAVVVWQLVRTTTEASLAPPAITYVPIRENLEPSVIDVDLVLTRAPAPELLAPVLTGVVEAIAVQPSDMVRDGTALFVADGITRLAVASPRPFGRPLSYLDAGVDVTALNELLGRLGYARDAEDVVAGATVEGINDLAADIGAPETGVFEPGWVVYLPMESLVVADIGLRIGAPVPAAGEVLMTGTAPPLAGVLVAPGTVAEASPSEGDADGASPSPPVTIDQHTPLITAPPGAVLSLDSVELGLRPDRQGVDAVALETLAATIAADSSVLNGQLTTPPAPGEFILPPAALFTDSGGQTCVLRRRDGHSEAVSVSVRRSVYDRAIVTGDLLDGDEAALSVPAEQRRCVVS